MAGGDQQGSLQGRTGSTSAQEEARRERKRATDRKSQRDHRERQKAYIRQLEETVKNLRADSTTDERLATLLDEQERLQKANARLSSQLERVRNIVLSDDDAGRSSAPMPAANDLIRSRTPDCAERRSARAAAKAISSPGPHSYSSFHLHSGLSESLLHPDLAQVDLAGAAAGVAPMGCNMAPIVPMVPPPCATASLATSHPVCNCMSNVVASCIPLTLQPGNKPPAMPQSLPHAIPPPQPPPAHSIPAPILSESLNASLPGPTVMPAYCNPVGSGDAHLMAMLEEARAEHRAGRFNPARPSLRQLLAERPYDILSFRLFNYIRGYGAMPLHLMLGVFYTHYVVLRWQVVQTEAAYFDLPDFLRPLPIQYQVPHRIIIGLLVWSDIRAAIIQDHDNVNPETLAIDMLEALSSRWHPCCDNNNPDGALPSLDIVHMIQRDCYTTDFWKIGPSFPKKYPQYAHLRLG